MAYTKGKGKYQSKSKSTGKNESTGSKVAQIAVDQLYKAIFENGEGMAILPWQRPYNFDCMNWFSERTYKGFNFLYLSFVGSGEYVTEAQLKKYNEAKGTDFAVLPIQKEDGTMGKRYPRIAVYWNISEKQISEETAKKLKESGKKNIKQKTDGTYMMQKFSLIYHGVYDIADIEDSKGNKLPSKIALNKDETEYQDIEEVLNTYMQNIDLKLEVNTTGDAYHLRSRNIVSMPERSYFKSNIDYYKTLAHELVHSTGVANRLNRKSLIDYREGKENRGQEELVAEYGSNLLLARCGLNIEEIKFDNSIDYIRGWCTWMRKNPDAFLKAITDAEEAVEYILNGGFKIDEGKKVTQSKETDAKEEQPKKKPNVDIMVNYFLRQSTENDKRGMKCYNRALNNGMFEKLVDVKGVNPNQFNIIGTSKTGEPILSFQIDKDTKLICGFTFAIYVKSDEDYKVIYNVFNTTNLSECEERAKEYNIPQLTALSKCVYLRGGGK